MLRVAWHASARQVRQRAALSACACVQPQYHHQQHQLQHGRALHAATPVARRKRRYTAPGEDGIDVKYWTGDGMWRETAARQAEVIAAAGEFGNEETDRMFEAHSRRQKRIDQQGKLSYHYDPKLPPTDRPRMEILTNKVHDKPLMADARFGARRIRVNRSSTLNTLDTLTLQAITEQLLAYEKNDIVEAVILESHLDEIYMKGGDVQSLAQMAREPATRARALAYLKAEYTLSHLINTYKKPLVNVINGHAVGVGHCFLGQYNFATSDTAVSFPQSKEGRSLGGGASHVLSRLPHGMGMYLALTGDDLRAHDVYFAQLTNHAGEAEALRKDFLYSIARNTVDERVSLNIEQHWLYKNTVSLMRDLRGESRWEVLNEEIDVSSQDLERYSALKGWNQMARRGVPLHEAEKWFNSNHGGEELGELYNFGADDAVNDYWEPLEPEHHFKRDRMHSAITVFQKAATLEAPQRLQDFMKDVGSCFAGDTEQGDQVLLMRRPPPEPTKEEIIKNVVQGSKLPADWQQGNAKLNGRRFSSLIGNALMTEACAPIHEEMPALQQAVVRGVESAFPFGIVTRAQAAQLLTAAGLTVRESLPEGLQAAIVVATAVHFGIAPSVLRPERPEGVPLGKEFDDETFHEADILAEMDTLNNTAVTLEHPFFYNQINEEDVSARATELLEKRREQLATAEKDEEETEESLAWPELDELFNSSLPEYDGIAADDEESIVDDQYTEEQLKEIRSDPEKLRLATGMPATPVSKGAMEYVVAELKKIEDDKHGVVQVKSVEAVMDRLANRNDEWSKQVMALMATASPTALKVNHRLLVESSTLPTVAESLALEHRTAVRMLFHPDMAAAAKAQETNAAPAWSKSSLAEVSDADVDAIVAELAPSDPIFDLHGIRQDMEELQLSLNRSVGLTGDEQADEERWLTELKKWYGQGVSRGAGTAEMRSRHAWTTGQKYWEPVPDPETAALREEEERGPLRSRGRGGQRGGRR